MRFENLKSPEAYIERLSGGVPSSPCKLGLDGEANGAFTALLKTGLPVQKANIVTRRTRISDLIILGLRILEGIDPCRFRESTGYDITNESREVIDELESFGLLERVKGRLRLSQRGRLLGNEVFQRFIDLPSIRD
jgi:oxygen-independent coproporphyrinogen-3 oxidase